MRIRAFLLATGVTGASVAGGLAFTGVASAQSPSASPCARGQADYPVGPTGQQVDDTTPARGQRMRGRGCASPRSSQTQTFESHPQVVSTSTSDDNGLYTFEFTVPRDAEDGPHTLTSTGPGVVDGVTRLVVSGDVGDDAGDGDGGGGGGRGDGGQGRGGGGGGRGLPRTGNTSTAPLTAAGVGLVLIGGFAVTAARRRRTAQAIDS